MPCFLYSSKFYDSYSNVVQTTVSRNGAHHEEHHAASLHCVFNYVHFRCLFIYIVDLLPPYVQYVKIGQMEEGRPRGIYSNGRP